MDASRQCEPPEQNVAIYERRGVEFDCESEIQQFDWSAGRVRGQSAATICAARARPGTKTVGKRTKLKASDSIGLAVALRPNDITGFQIQPFGRQIRPSVWYIRVSRGCGSHSTTVSHN